MGSELLTGVELAHDNLERLGFLNAKGIQIGGIDEHYLRELLEAMLDEDQVQAAHERQETWLAGELDRIEKEVTAAQFLAPSVRGR